MNLRVSKARRKDLSAVVALLTQMNAESPVSLAAAARVYRDMARYPSYSCYLALDGRDPIGTFTMLVFPSLAANGGLEARIGDLVVATERRGHGIGGAMLAEAMRLAAEAGCRRLTLAASPLREDLDRFYRSLGFRRQGVSFWIDIVPLGNPRLAMRERAAARM